MRRLKVKEVAQSRGFTIARLERTAGIDIKTVRSIWHNPRHNASFETLEKIAAAIGVPVTTLIEDDSQPSTTVQAEQLGEIVKGLRELDRLAHYVREDHSKYLLESPLVPTSTETVLDEIEQAKSKLQALLPGDLKVLYVQEYSANGIFASDTSSTSNSTDINYPLP